MVPNCNHENRKRGPEHHRASLSTAQVDDMRDLFEAGGRSYKSLADAFGCGVSTARDIVLYRTRCTG